LDTFRWISVVISLLLGLGVTRLLLGAIGVFRARHRGVFDWIPILWAVAIFFQQITFWWGLEAAGSAVTNWTLPAFIMLVGLTLALFLAAALILPFDTLGEGETLRTYFERDGRFGLLGLAAFNAIAILANAAIWQEGLLAESVRLNLVLTIVPIAGFLGPRRAQTGAALAYTVIVVWAIVELSPFSY